MDLKYSRIRESDSQEIRRLPKERPHSHGTGATFSLQREWTTERNLVCSERLVRCWLRAAGCSIMSSNQGKGSLGVASFQNAFVDRAFSHAEHLCRRTSHFQPRPLPLISRNILKWFATSVLADYNLSKLGSFQYLFNCLDFCQIIILLFKKNKRSGRRKRGRGEEECMSLSGCRLSMSGCEAHAEVWRPVALWHL